MPTRERKGVFYEKLYKLLETHDSLLIVGVDNVGSFQLAQIRKALRKDELATILMGKNTLMRKVIAAFVAANPDHPIAAVSEHLRGNVGFVFVRKDMAKVREVIAAEKKGAPAKVGSIAENDVEIPAGPTGCDPGQTSFFQALSVPTKISKGQIEIVSALRLIKKGDKVGPSEAALLQKLNILPFSYGVKFLSVYMNGSVFPADVLDISEDVVRRNFVSGTRFLAAFSLGVGIPTAASLPHSLGRAARDVLALAAVTGYSSKFTAKWDKLFSLSPEELAKLGASSGGGAASSAPAAGGAAAAAPAKVEKVEEAGDALEGGLFPTGGGGGKY